MADRCRIVVDGRGLEVPRGAMLAAVMVNLQLPTRRSVGGAIRAPLCGMGICFECCAIVDGTPCVRTCQVACRDGMEVRTDA